MIHHLSFGETYPGQVHPLDGYRDIATEDPATGEWVREGGGIISVLFLCRWNDVPVLHQDCSHCV